MMRKYRFNMVEIMLAIVVLSLGMTMVFVLFPAGLSSHRTAMAENSLADLAELIMSHVRAELTLGSNEVKFTAAPAAAGSTAVTYDLDDDPTSKWTAIDGGGTLWQGKTDKNVYLIRQLSGPPDDRYADFAAIARVYPDNNSDFSDDLLVPMKYGSAVDYYGHMDKSKSGVTGTSAGDIRVLNIYDFLFPMVLEISWPANIPYADREKAYFRFEIFNENFEQKVK